MLQLINIDKSYTIADFTQHALDDVSISFRENEFVAILGPSGSGKTTLLNIIGGLDQYDSGDLVIDGTSTSQYKDRDWDTYRNNRIGFIFQSYNLIPHQTVLANVELALTLSGVERAERRQRAIEALERVGLGDHINKRPNQLSGGQMQRVAVARALINDPEILLADEPTGALDSTTSTQIMELLAEIAKERLIIMVTHNPELAAAYANRTVKLYDGRVTEDSNPFYPEMAGEQAEEKSIRRTSMSFFTAVALSFNNLMTKKGRTIMTAVAGSIGIIGIAAILSLANGVNNYIARIEEDTLSLYPLTIESTGFDMTSIFMSLGAEFHGEEAVEEAEASDEGLVQRMVNWHTSSGSAASDGQDETPRTISETKIVANMITSLNNNDLASLKRYFESDETNVHEYANIITYGYGITPLIFSNEATDTQRQLNPNESLNAILAGGNLGGSMGEFAGLITGGSVMNVFTEMLDSPSMLEAQYDIVTGKWPERYDEIVLVLGPTGGVSDFVLFSMGLRDQAEFDEMVKAVVNDEEIVVDESRKEFTPEQLMAVTFKVVNRAATYQYDSEHKVWLSKVDDEKFMKSVIAGATTLKIVGIVEHNGESQAQALMPGFAYSPRLQEYLIAEAAKSKIVKEQLAHRDLNIISGRTFQDEIDHPQETTLDLASMFGLEEGAFDDLFKFDTSALNFDLSAMDFASMDFSSMDPSILDLGPIGMPPGGPDIAIPPLDLGNLGGSSGALQLTPEQIEQIMGGIDWKLVLSHIDFTTLEPNEEVIMQLTQDLMQAFLTSDQYDYRDPVGSFMSFLNTDEAQDLILAALPEAFNLEAFEDQIYAALAPQLSEIMNEIMAGIQADLIKALEKALQEQLTGVLTQMMTQAIEQAVRQALTRAIPLVLTQMMNQISAQLTSALTQQLAGLGDALDIDPAALMDAFDFKIDPAAMRELMMAALSFETNSFEGNLRKFDYADMAKPTSINIYPKDFDAKAEIIAILDAYNERMEAQGKEDQVIQYTDFVGTLMKSVTSIINTISYVLIAFVAISLVVSSIMIGIITYISVLERKKEIGILRSIGASKGDIGRVFNAETLIVGLAAGLIGVGLTGLATIPINYFIGERMLNISNITILPLEAGAILVAISMVLSFVAGLIPSSAASRRDPVEALRSE